MSAKIKRKNPEHYFCPLTAGVLEGTVVKSTGKYSLVKLIDGKVVTTSLKGKMRLQKSRETHVVAVGDKVTLEKRNDDWIIEDILPRRNQLNRKATKLSRSVHVVAANIDQILIIASAKNPKTPLGFIDRVTATAESYSIPSILIINKIDLLDSDEDVEKWTNIGRLYQDIGFEVIPASIYDTESMEKVLEILRGRETLVTGQSGVGKSSIINAIDPVLNIKTSVVSNFNEKGKHTTTFAEMHKLSFGGHVIDTPGVRSFGLIEIDRRFLSHYFPEMEALLGQCKYYDCTHLDEPGCKVKEMVDRGEIAESRYMSYLSMYYEG